MNNIYTTLHGMYLEEKDPFIIVDCDTCHVPMVVFINHNEPSAQGLQKAIEIAEESFPEKRVDLKRRKIPEHPHFHLR